MAIDQAENDNNMADDVAYWKHNLVPVLSSLMKSAGTYSADEQEAQLRLLTEHALPRLGPRPSAAHTTSFLTQSHSPLQPQMNFRPGQSTVRYCWEPLGAQGGSESDPFAIDAARDALQHLSAAFNLCTKWSDALFSAFAPTSEEVGKVQEMLPKWLAGFGPPSDIPPPKRLPFSMIGIDMKGSGVGIKAYFNPKIKEFATGKPATDLAWEALGKLKPGLEPVAIDTVADFLSQRPVPCAIELIGIDWVKEAAMSDARVKIYVHCRNNSFNTVRDYVTLGGLIQDETTTNGLKQLSEIWHLLLQEPEGIASEDYDKPLTGISPMYQKLYFSFELRPGKKLPEVKTYLPTWHYVRSDEETVQNYEQVFRLCGLGWGEHGRYKKLFESAFGSVKHGRKCKDSIYRISRTDGDLLVLSRKYLDELHNAPLNRLSSIQGLIKNFGGHYSGISLLGESDVGTRALQLLGHVTQRVFIGLPLCRNQKWLDISSQHAHNVTMTQMAMRVVPPWMRPLLDLVLPSCWKYKACIRGGKELIAPEVRRRRHLEETDPDYVRPEDLLQAMMDLSAPGEKQSQAEDLAHRQLLMTLVAGHSTAAAGAHALFDLVARPECLEELRCEAIQLLQHEGGCWQKQSLSKLSKMDSFLRESQRMNPPSLLGFHRIVQDPAGIRLHDGVHVPYGTHICIPPHSISSDPAMIRQPDVFDGLRYFERRRAKPEEGSRHQHATADKDHLHFGYGTWSCPGRFLASAELKMVLVELLLRYEFKYSEGESRPVNHTIEEFPYLDVETSLLMRRRRPG
ncbi:hypothetical protein L249_4571 [Ophiocordyceps polyrhachis-furcata BCC 54312]|uniref:P450 monooxygenase n=1 Tax=Ophiocordyceps polyrhachis-furcata BCC 54312 TaxID=1330021 RepID=A0A367KZ68_9HYPO|nr:hypothetical protein L249_4571 [Ophiocordyceps polyrhachis-furcata BCC 54312]